MRKRTKRWIASYTKRGSRRQTWKKLVQFMACIVVFCTTYALILPAITMDTQYICGMQEHIHTGECHDGEGQQVCTLAEHIHGDICQPDPTADLESAEKWESTVSSVTITGDWPKDLLAVARTQLGYTQSQRNVRVRLNGTVQFYSRYGAWFLEPYGEWDAKFAAFCLNYAQVPRKAIPWDSDSGDWLRRVERMDIVRNPADEMPLPGDLVFFTKGSGVTMGIVSAVETTADPETGESAVTQLCVIAGDADGRVAELYVNANRITGFCPMDLVREHYADKYPGKQDQDQPEITEPGADVTEFPENTGDSPQMPTEAPETPGEMPDDIPEENTGGEPERISRYAETENYIVIVTHDADLVIPEGAELKAMEYARDSEIFRRRCAEAGYELEWLLNIGFFIGEWEVDMNGQFDVQVISKNGNEMGSDITHFADSGVEHIDGTKTDDRTEAGQTSVAFPADSFSDFGGGIAVAAETGPITLTVVDPSQLASGVEYVIFFRNNNSTFLALGNRSCSSINIGRGSAPSVGTEFDLPTGTSLSDITWRLERISNSNNFHLFSTSVSSNNRLHVHSGKVQLQGEAKELAIYDVSGARARLGHPWRSGNSTGTNYLHYQNNGWTGLTNNTGNTANIYFAVQKNYPDAVHTGTYEVGTLRFYNFTEGENQKISALSGCVFEIKGTTLDGKPYEKTIVSGENSEITFSVPDGDYTITEVSTPMEYLRDEDNVREFHVRDGKFANLAAIGYFINHKLEALNNEKNAEVEDYNNRIYQIQLASSGYLWTYDMDPVDVLFVVDKSNSMLFPSGMNPVQSNGVDVTVTLNANGTNNVANLDRLAAEGKINRNEMYYIISDPNASSTVWCLWHDGEAWVYQDASYYAKAFQENGTGYKQGDDTVVYPKNQAFAKNYGNDPDGKGVLAVNGGGMGFSMANSSIATDISNGRTTFTIYQAVGEYNRLHYLEESLSNMILELAELNPKNTVTLVPFTKEVKEADCSQHAIELNVQGVNELLTDIRNINTDGGTRQDVALQHVYEEHLVGRSQEYRDSKNFVVLITDGAPAGTKDIGSPSDPANKNGMVYAKIKYWANQVKAYMRQGNVDNTTLMTVALGMQNVDAGKEVLQMIASGDDMYCALDDASALVNRIQQLIFSNMKPAERVDFISDITDVVSDSFYPIAWVPRGSVPAGHQALSLKASSAQDGSREWIVLKPGDWITLDGRYTTKGASNAAGEIVLTEDGRYSVQWRNANVGSGWRGNLFVKAKEDFIGGNAIETNHSANITVRYPYELNEKASATLANPNVNVRLLDMNEMKSEVTVYKGDLINEAGDAPLDSLKYFYEHTEFTKLISDDGKVLNKAYEGNTPPEGLQADTFSLRYAMGDLVLTDVQWQTLMDNGTVNVAYTYDEASSGGPVGYFTFRLEKSQTGNYAEHTAEQICNGNLGTHTDGCTAPAEKYTLYVTYTAYALGEGDRDKENLKNSGNGAAGPGTEVGKGSTPANGVGVLRKANVHEVHVISGSIVITKKFASNIVAQSNTTFRFILHREEDGSDTTHDVEKTITIRRGQTVGSQSITFDGLRRGTYTVTEAEHNQYMVHKIRVLDATNCYSSPPVGSEARVLLFRMGHNRTDADVITKVPGERYTSYTDSPNGVHGAAEFTNRDKAYEGEIPVEKVWEDGTNSHRNHEIYVVLLEDGVPVRDSDGYAMMLRLNRHNNWQGVFTVTLAHKNDTVAAHNFTVREVNAVSATELYPWQKAKIVDTDEVIWYERTVDEGKILGIDGKGYIVGYEKNGDAWTVTNYRGYELPKTGGIGTFHFTFGGSLMVASALMYICITGHKRQKGGR